MKRLLCILNSTDVGGAETFIMKVFREIDKSQYMIDFCINVFHKCAYDDEIMALGGRIFRIPSKSSNVYEFKKQLYSIVKENGYEYVLRVTSNAGGLLDLKIAKQAGAIVCSARSSNSSDGNGLKDKIVHRLGRLLWMKYVDKKIAPSDLAAIYTFGEKAYRKGNVYILKNGLDLKRFAYNESNRISSRNELGISTDCFLIGHVGRFVNQKNHAFLVEVFTEFHKSNHNSKLLLIGSGPLEQDLKKTILDRGLQEDVVFAGIRKDIPQLLSAIDCFVFPSLYEGMPNAVIEAQASGLPCVVSDTITKTVNITDNVCFLSLQDSFEKWANAISKNLSRCSINAKLREAGYDIETVAQNFVDIVFK